MKPLNEQIACSIIAGCTYVSPRTFRDAVIMLLQKFGLATSAKHNVYYNRPDGSQVAIIARKIADEMTVQLHAPNQKVADTITKINEHLDKQESL